MLELKFIREHREEVERSAREKGYQVKIGEVLDIDEKRRKELAEVEKLRQERNEVAAQMKGGKPEPALIEKVRKSRRA